MSCRSGFLHRQLTNLGWPARTARLDLGETAEVLLHADFVGRFWVGSFGVDGDETGDGTYAAARPMGAPIGDANSSESET